MAKKKYVKPGRDPIILICQKLVETHNDRKQSIALMKEERAALQGKLPGLKLTDMPRGPSRGINDPVYEINSLIEQIDIQISEEQYRVDVVEAAIDNIGFYEKDNELRAMIRKTILENIKQGGYSMPYERAPDYPEKYSRNDFYQQRKRFLLEIAKNLNLILKS